MSERDLERLIDEWYRRDSLEADESRLLPSGDCPPLTRLWQHHAEGRPLDEYEGHVERCHRCRRVSEIIERERKRLAVPAGARDRSAASTAARGPGRRWLYVAGPTLAAAACLALFFVSWPQPNFDPQVAAFAERAYPLFAAPTMRGEHDQRFRGDSPEEREWLTTMLADPVVIEAIEVQDSLASQIVFEISEGRLRINPDGGLTIAPNIPEPTARAELSHLIDRDRRATEQIVDVLLRILPGASDKDRPRVRRAMDRFRTDHVFGRPKASNKTDPRP